MRILTRYLVPAALLVCALAGRAALPSNTLVLSPTRSTAETQLAADRARRAGQARTMEEARQALVRKRLLPAKARMPRFATYITTASTRAASRGRSGGGAFTFAFQGFESYPQEERMLRDFLLDQTRAYQQLVNLYGPPAETCTLAIVRDPALADTYGGEISYDAGSRTITLRLPPVPSDFAGDDSSLYAYDLLTLLLHAFHQPAVIGFDAWEEGMARAVALVAMTLLRPDFSLAYMGEYLLPVYDCLNRPELSTPSFFPSKGLSIMRLWRVGMALSAWLKVYTENPDVFRTFHAAYYAQYASNPALASDLAGLKALMATALPGGVEGDTFSAWYAKQHILQPTTTPGAKLFVYALPMTDWVALHLHYYQVVLATTGTGGQEAQELPLGGTATFSVTAWDGMDLTHMPDEWWKSPTAIIPATAQGGMEGGYTVVSPTFMNIGGVVPQQRLRIGVSIGGLQREATYAHRVRQPGEPNAYGPENAVFGAITGADSGSLEIVVKNRVTTVPVTQGAFMLVDPQPIPLFQPAVFTFTADDGHTLVQRRNVGPGFYTPILADSGGTALQRRFPRGMAMVSFPLAPTETDPQRLFYPTGGPVEFRFALWDPTAPEDPVTRTRYRYYPATAARAITPGQGYWLQLDTDRNVRVTGLPVHDGERTISLAPGWNMIGNTYTRAINPWAMSVVSGAVSLPLIEAIRQGVVSPVWQYQPADGSYLCTVSLGAWEGAWIANQTGGTLTLVQEGASRSVATPMPTTGTPTAQMLAVLTGGQWGTAISAAQGSVRDRVYLGRNLAARPGLDGMDWPKPPPATGLTIGLTHPARRGVAYASDMRPALAPAGEVWEFIVTIAKAGEVTLLWPTKPGSGVCTLALEDVTTGARTDMERYTSYRYTPTAVDVAAGRRFRVTATPIAPIVPAIEGLTATARAGSGATLAFRATVAGEASATIRTVTGRVVCVLPWVAGPAGARALAWDGRDVGGVPAARGTYSATVQFRAGNATLAQTVPLVLQ